MKPEIRELLYIMAALLCLYPEVSSAEGLVFGIVFALILENPFPTRSRKWSSTLLQLSVIGLGGVMDFHVITKVGMQGIGYTAFGITLTLLLGFILGRALNVSRDATTLIGSGTAICGGSAIAAVAPIINAGPEDISVSLIVVFLLNSIALLIFPTIGHYFHLDQNQFGLWAALAIHDTSSVVGASLQYGPKALEIATAVKLARALWIVPVAGLIGFLQARKKSSLGKIKKPWFILGFVILALVITTNPILHPTGRVIAAAARRLLVVTLFLIGSSLTRSAFKSVGIRPFVLGFVLWACVASATLAAILYKVI